MALSKKTSGLSEKIKPELFVYPDGRNLVIEGDEKYIGKTVVLFDNLGRLVNKQILSPGMMVDISGCKLSKGIYIVRVNEQTVKVFLGD